MTEQVAEARGRVWAYRGGAAARERLARGAARAAAPSSARSTVDDVEHGFRRLGDAQLARYRATTDPLPPGCEALMLERIELP